MRNFDIVVIGAGLAGILAALFASRQQKKVALLSSGAGSLAISSGSIDVLGYAGGRRVEHPLDAIDTLPAGHPYSIAGADSVRSSLALFKSLCDEAGFPLAYDRESRNLELVTVMGTTKPAFMCQESFDSACMHEADRAVILTVENMKDVHPAMIAGQLRRCGRFPHTDFECASLPCPVSHIHRNITPLDMARHVDTPEGEAWLMESLAPYAERFPVILLPPILGVRRNGEVWQKLHGKCSARVIEMVSIPPGVAGLRLREALMHMVGGTDICMVENATVTHAELQGDRCIRVFTEASGGSREWEAEQFVAATGGILGGGISTAPGKAWETVFNIPIEAPEDPQEWSSPEIFGPSFFASIGVRVNGEFLPVDAGGKTLLSNVRFAGSVLGGYDFGTEKSGDGVALVTGIQAGFRAGGEKNA